MGLPVHHPLGQPLHLPARQINDCKNMCMVTQKLNEGCNDGRHFKVGDLPGHYTSLQSSSFDLQIAALDSNCACFASVDDELMLLGLMGGSWLNVQHKTCRPG